MLSRLATKLHSRMGAPGDSGPIERAFARIRRPLGRVALRREGLLAELDRLGRSVDAARPQGEPPAPASATRASDRRVLVLSLRAWTTHNVYESLLAQGLRVRGAEVALLTCGSGQPVCEMGWARRAWPRPCDRCGWYTERIARAARLPHYRLAGELPWGEDARRAPPDPPPSPPEGPDPRRASEISVPWVLKSTDVEASPHGPAIARDFAVATGGVATAAQGILDDFNPDTVVLVNALFAAERAIGEAALARGIRVVSYEMAPRENALVFSAGTPAPLYDTSSAWKRSRDRPLSPHQRDAIEAMLAARSAGRGAHERYYDEPLADLDRIRAALDVPPGARVVSLFTNLAWDSAVVGRDLAYDSMLDWIADAVRVAAELDDLMLVVRVHPAEQRWGTMQPVAAALGRLPANVRVIGPEQPVDSYALLGLSDLVLTYTTTVGLEAAVRGVPVAVAARTHYRGRGFTYDLESPAGLRSLLNEREWPMSEEQAELALRYAFMFFFRCMIPFPAVPLEQGRPRGAPDDVTALRPGADAYLDFVCERILDGGDFILPDELALPAGATP